MVQGKNMKIAILTSGLLPVPATKGGAVETKLDYILDYNSENNIIDFTVYSIKPDSHNTIQSKSNHYIFFSISSLFSKIKKNIYKRINKNPYYDDTIEYFLHKCIVDIKKKSFDGIIIANRPGYITKIPKSIQSKIILQINNDYLNTNTLRAQEIKNACSLIITCSDYLNQKAAAVNTNKNIPIKTVHNGIDIKRFVDATPKNREFLGLKKDDFVVLFSGRLTPEKGILELIQAVKNINNIRNLKLVIVGASFYGKDTHVSPFLEKLQNESEDIKDKVVFTGFINYQEMPSILKTADIAVVPSLWEEPFGLTVLEAMASGLPLIATRCGGIPEICQDVALLIERENLRDNLVDAISYLYMNPQIAKTMKEKAQKRSWDFDKEGFSKNYIQAIIDIFNH